MPIAQLAGGDEAWEDKSKTFVFHNEGHTLGNALRYIVSSYQDVQFCGYTVPHPSESKIHFRIQMYKGRAIDALRRGLNDLVQVCDITLESFENEVSTFKEENPSNLN